MQTQQTKVIPEELRNLTKSEVYFITEKIPPALKSGP